MTHSMAKAWATHLLDTPHNITGFGGDSVIKKKNEGMQLSPFWLG